MITVAFCNPEAKQETNMEPEELTNFDQSAIKLKLGCTPSKS